MNYYGRRYKKTELRKQYEQLTNPLSNFLNEFTEEDANDFIPKWIFKEVFTKWQRIKGYREWNDREIGKEMQFLGYETKQKTLDSEEANNTLNTFFSNFSKVYRKSYKKGAKPAKGDRNWRCWIGLKWKETLLNQQNNKMEGKDCEISGEQAKNFKEVNTEAEHPGKRFEEEVENAIII